MCKKLIFVLVCFTVLQSKAVKKSSELPCAEQIVKILDKWNFASEKRSLASLKASDKLILQNIAEGKITLQQTKDMIFLAKEKDNSLYQFSFQKKDCNAKFQTRTLWSADKKFNLPPELEKIQRSSCDQPALIYAWSGNMQISVQGLFEAMRFADEKKLKLYTFEDPNATERNQEVKKGIKSKSSIIPLQFVNADILTHQGLNNHFPAFIIAKNCKLSPLQFGYRTQDALEQELQRSFE